MGTHPIFESDFDCLTEWKTKWMIRWTWMVLLPRPWSWSRQVRLIQNKRNEKSVKSALTQRPDVTLACSRAKAVRDSFGETFRKMQSLFVSTTINAMFLVSRNEKAVKNVAWKRA